MPPIEIDRNGDVTLLLTKSISGSPDETTSILVSSKVLSLASPVFAAMLGPRFREGQRSASGALDPIPLPDDPVDAMIILCRILHFDYTALPVRIVLEHFKDLALVCDKYDCVTPLRYVSEQWLLKWETTAEKAHLQTLLIISYTFDRPERFDAFSARIVKELGGDLRELATLRAFDGMSEDLLESLHQQRKGALELIEKSVIRQLETLSANAKYYPRNSWPTICSTCWKRLAPKRKYCSDCPVSIAITELCSLQSRRSEYFEILKKVGLEPIGLSSSMAKKSISEIVDSVGRAPNEAFMHDCGTDTFASCGLSSTMSSLSIEVRNLAAVTRGLCLDCVKSGRQTAGLNMIKSDQSVCRVKHGEIVVKI